MGRSHDRVFLFPFLMFLKSELFEAGQRGWFVVIKLYLREGTQLWFTTSGLPVACSSPSSVIGVSLLCDLSPLADTLEIVTYEIERPLPYWLTYNGPWISESCQQFQLWVFSFIVPFFF